MNTIPLFLGMSGGEIAFILFIAVMVFGADKIPEIAKGLGKGLQTIRNATNDIKDEVMKSADDNTSDTKEIGKEVKGEIDKVKDEIKEITGSVKRRF